MKNFNDFANDLGARESGNKYNIKNTLGFLGRWQFGKPRLWDLGYSINGWKPKNREAKKMIAETTFLKSPELQDEIFKNHIADLLKRAKQNYGKYIGTTVNNILITESGLVAGAHLKGFGGVNQFLAGKDNSDAFGTQISEYIKKFGGYNLENNLHVHLEETKDIPKRDKPYTEIEEKNG